MSNAVLTDLSKNFADLLRQNLGEYIHQIILFGSRSRNDFAEYSDYDIVLIVENNNAEIRDVVLNIEIQMLDEYDTHFSTLIYDPIEWELEKGTPLGWNIENDGIVL